MDSDYLEALAGDFPKNEIITEIMRAHGKDVWNYAFSLTGKADMADDISQDVFLKVVQQLHTFRGESSMKTWLLKITKNTPINKKNSGFMKKVFLVGKWLDREAGPCVIRSSQDDAKGNCRDHWSAGRYGEITAPLCEDAFCQTI